METKISVEYYMQGIVVDSSEHFEVCVWWIQMLDSKACEW